MLQPILENYDVIFFIAFVFIFVLNTEICNLDVPQLINNIYYAWGTEFRAFYRNTDGKFTFNSLIFFLRNILSE